MRRPDRRAFATMLRLGALLGGLGIVALSSYPHGLPMRSFFPSWAEHFLAYVLQGAFLALAFPGRVRISLALLVASAGCLELIQFFVDRHPDPIDFAASSVGAACGGAAVWVAKSTYDRLNPAPGR